MPVFTLASQATFCHPKPFAQADLFFFRAQTCLSEAAPAHALLHLQQGSAKGTLPLEEGAAQHPAQSPPAGAPPPHRAAHAIGTLYSTLQRTCRSKKGIS